jgi:arabinan endo-1,5-alpha-L-arabinosidase
MRRALRTAAAVVATAALVPALAACAGGAPSAGSPSPTTAPFQIDRDFPDPGAIVDGGTVYAYATNAAGVNVQLATSKDMRHWEVRGGDVLPQLPVWALPGKTWAPGPAKIADGRYALYVTATDAASGRQCIGAAFASDPAGPFTSTETAPLVCPVDQGGAIDAASFVDADGQRYLVWKNDGNCCGLPTWIQLQPLSADGATLAGDPVKLITQTEQWEGNLVEAPVIVRHDGGYVLLYSANDYGGGAYAIGAARASALAGPYTKHDGPLLSTSSSGGRYTGPGGADLVTFQGRDWMLFHSWDDSTAYRGMHAVPVTWRGGYPVPDGSEG